MDCKQSEIAMMQHMEKTITPADARSLAKHILACETCREYYLAFDEAMELLTDDIELTAPPEDFTKSVMTKINAAANVAEKPAVVEAVSVVSDGQIFIKIVWGIGAILMGFGLYFIFNPALLPEITIEHPAIDGFQHAFNALGQFLNQGVQRLSQMDISAQDSIGVFALFFVIMLGGLLTVLHREESGGVKA